MMRTYNVQYDHDDGWNETQIDIQDEDFVSMFNSVIVLVNQIAEESGEKNPRIIDIEEVQGDG